MSFIQTIQYFDQSKRKRFFSIALLLSPFAVTAKWFDVVHGFFAYDDFDLLLVIRETPFIQSLFVFHGDSSIPLFRIFFALMYHAFGVNELFWNVYPILLLLAINLLALAIMIELGVGLVSAAFFYVVMLTAPVWQNVSLGYYTLSMYHQIGLCGLLASFALLRWMHSHRASYKWLTVLPSATAPFIHTSGVYVPVAVFGIAMLIGLAAGKQQKSLPSLIRHLKWLLLAQAVILAIFAVYFAAAFIRYGGPLFEMARAGLSFESVATSLYLFVSDGLALELFHSLVGTVMPHEYMYGSLLATIAFCGAAIYFVAGLTLLRKNERLVCAALLVSPAVIALIVAFGRRITDINYFIASCGKYNSVALLWFAMAAIYIADCVVRHYLAHLRKQVAVLTFVTLALVVGRHALSTNPWIKDVELRRQELYDLVAVFGKYAERTAPMQMRIATLDGEYIDPPYKLLFKYNLAHYRPFFGSFDSRLTLLRNAAMSNWGSEAMTTVASLRNAVDRDFLRALETDPSLQALYFGAIELQTTPGSPPPTVAPMALDQLKLSNAQSVAVNGGALSFSTAGGAEIRLVEGPFDPEVAHVLTLAVTGESVGATNAGVEIELTFSGELQVPYAANTIRVPANGEPVSIDLLQLYSYALNPTVRDLTLRFPRGGNYRISGVDLR